jgi:hypothetical protein
MNGRPDDDRIARYLLDELPPEEREEFEDRYLTDEGPYADLLAVEDDLIDLYCEGGLPSDRRQRFEARYLATAEGRERVEFARALKRFAARPAAPATAPRTKGRPPSWLAWAAVVVAALGALLVLVLRQDGEAGRARAELESLQRQIARQEEQAREQDRRLAKLGEEAASAREQAQVLAELLGVGAGRPLRAASLLLTGGLRRDAATLPRLTPAPGVEIVRLQLPLPGPPRGSYRASLQTAEGRELWARDELRPANAGGPLTFTVPAAVLAPGHYVVTLAAGPAARRGDTEAEYVFAVRRPR